MSNISTIQELYNAFRRGDIPMILSKLSDEIEWEYGVISTTVPWLQRGVGHEGASAFFASLEGMEIHTFVPKMFFEGDNIVVVLLDVEFTVKATGKRVFEEDEIHIWWFDAEGKVARFRHRVDTQLHQLAYNVKEK